MQSFDQLRIERIQGERSRLVSERGVSVEVEGIVLEAQFRCSRGYLVITSDNSPYEELLHFYLLTDSGQILDELSLGRMYHPGILRNVVLHAEDRLDFSFFGSERWSLTILDRPLPRLPCLFSSVKRKGWFGSHLLNLERSG